MEEIDSSIIPERNIRFRIVTDTSGTILLLATSIDPPKLLEIYEIESVRKPILETRMILSPRPFTSELLIFSSEYEKDILSLRPVPTSPKLPKFELFKRFKFSFEGPEFKLEEVFFVASLNKNRLGMYSHMNFSPSFNEKFVSETIEEERIEKRIKKRIKDFNKALEKRKLLRRAYNSLFYSIVEANNMNVAQLLLNKINSLKRKKLKKFIEEENFDKDITVLDLMKDPEIIIDFILNECDQPQIVLHWLAMMDIRSLYPKSKLVLKSELILRRGVQIPAKAPFLTAVGFLPENHQPRERANMEFNQEHFREMLRNRQRQNVMERVRIRRAQPVELNRIEGYFKRDSLLLLRRKNLKRRYLTDLEVLFKAQIESEVFFLDDKDKTIQKKSTILLSTPIKSL